MGEGKEKKKRRIIYRQTGEKSVEKAANKSFPNKKCYKTYFIKKNCPLNIKLSI
jgi:hypothetical protein